MADTAPAEPASAATLTYDPETRLFHLAPGEGADAALVAQHESLLNAAAALLLAETGRTYWLPAPYHRRAERKRGRD